VAKVDVILIIDVFIDNFKQTLYCSFQTIFLFKTILQFVESMHGIVVCVYIWRGGRFVEANSWGKIIGRVMKFHFTIPYCPNGNEFLFHLFFSGFLDGDITPSKFPCAPP
jgi:hypothetical protein